MIQIYKCSEIRERQLKISEHSYKMDNSLNMMLMNMKIIVYKRKYIMRNAENMCDKEENA